jgi:hypothetical protein
MENCPNDQAVDSFSALRPRSLRTVKSLEVDHEAASVHMLWI